MIGEHQTQTGKGAAGIALDLTSASDTPIYTFLITEKCFLVEFGVTVDADLGATTTAVIELDRMPYHDGAKVEDIAEVDIPALAVTGDTYYDNPVDATTGKLIVLYPGDRLVVEVDTGANTTGTGWPYIKTERIPEINTNITGMHKSA